MPKKADELGPLDVKRLSEPGLHFVGGVAGLGLQITDSGSKSWVLRSMVGGKRRKMGLGGFPDVSLADARNAARAAKEKIRNGVDPIDEAKRNRQALAASRAKDVTFKKCAEQYIAAHKASWKNPKHQAQWESTLLTYAYPIIGDMWVRDVKLEHIMQILEPIWHSKTETAKRLRGRIETVLNSAITKGLRDQTNPARWTGGLATVLPSPSKIAKRGHFPAVPVPEMSKVFQQIKDQPGTAAKALQFLILTNVRSHNVRHARWCEIDMQTKTWLIPGEDSDDSKQRMKTGVSHRVPLSREALRLLESLPKVAGTDLIFPSPRKNVPLSDMAMSKLMKDMELNGVPHGFRSTFRDWSIEKTNFTREVTERAMAHAVGDKTEASYLRSDVFEKRRKLMEMWSNFCTEMSKAGAVVVQLA